VTSTKFESCLLYLFLFLLNFSDFVIKMCESFSSKKSNYFEGKYLLSIKVLTLLLGLTHPMLIVGVRLDQL